MGIDLPGYCVTQPESNIRSVLSVKRAHLHKRRHAHMLAVNSKRPPKAEAAKENTFSVYSQVGRSLA